MASASRAQLEHPVAERAKPDERRAAESARQIERRVTVPVVDEFEPGRVVYHASIFRLALLGALIGAAAAGLLAWIIAAGVWPLAEFGQFSASGSGVATFTGAGIGAAFGGLAGGLTALCRIPARHAHHRQNDHRRTSKNEGRES